MCNREQDVLDALQSGRMEELRDHLTECSECADLALVAGFLQRENEFVQEELRRGDIHLPSASFVWWKSKLRARRDAEQKVLQPVRIAEKIAAGAAASGLGAVAWWLWPASTSSLTSLWDLLQNSALAMGVGAAGVSVMVFAVYAVFARE